MMIKSAPSTMKHAPTIFNLLEPGATMNSSTDSRKRYPNNAVDMFRLNLHSNHALSTAGGNTWVFQINVPEELEQGLWMVTAESVVMSGNAAAATNTDRINNFYVSGLPLRDSFECTAAQESALLLSTVRNANTHTFVRNVCKDSLGIPLADLGQIRGRRVVINVRNGDGNLLGDSGLTHWTMGLVFYRFDA